MKINYSYLFYIVLLILSTTLSCTRTNTSDLIETNDGLASINLKWNKSYENETLEDAKTGLSWCYSHLGAKVLNSFVLSSLGEIITVNINDLGFNENATEEIIFLHQKIKNTEEYRQKNVVDIGRYISLLIGASEHYYKITGVPKMLDEILLQYELEPYKGYVNNSGVSFEHRIIEYSSQKELNQLFFCTEIDPISGEILEYETIEIMENGQLKFAMFDNKGLRKNAGNPEHTRAGKPAKCMWCHESSINPLFKEQDNFEGHLTYNQLNDTLTLYRKKLTNKQSVLLDGVNYNNKQDHTFMEILYVSFMEPSAERLSIEWGVTINEVKDKLSNIETHTHTEFSFLGNVYNRHEIEQFAPYKNLRVSTSIRENSENEINYLD